MLTKNEQKLNLSHNNYTVESSELKEYCIKYSNITELDISNNNFTTYPEALLDFKKITFLDFEKIVNTISKYPHLTILEIDLANQNQVFMILNRIPNLILLNGKSIKNTVTIIDLDKKDVEELKLQIGLPVFNELLNALNTFYPKNSAEYIKEYECKVLEGKVKIKDCINSNCPNYIYAHNVVQSQLITEKSICARFTTFLGTINKDYEKFAENIFNCVFKSADTALEIINSLYPKIEEKSHSLRNELENVIKTADEIGEYEERYRMANKEKDTILKQYENEKEIIQNKLERLETENKIMTEKLLKNAKDIYNHEPKVNQSKSLQSHSNQVNFKITQKNSQSFTQVPPGNLSNSQSLNLHQSQSIISHQNNNPMTASNILIGPTSSKMITMKIMKEKMNEIYASKIEYDKKCQENKIPHETMEQHMYTYLTQKYGLKNMIIEWASSIINGIKQYSLEDSDINLFGKILRNEQEEDSRFIIARLQTTILELLEYYIKSKNPNKSLREIKKLIDEKIQGSLKEEEWKGILYYIYNKEDAANIENRLKTLMHQSKNKGIQHLSKNITREEMYKKAMEVPIVLYKDFIKVVSDYQIKARDKYLRNFVQIFKKCDIDGDGILDENQFIDLIKLIPYCRDNVEEYTFQFLAIIDPFNKKRITFSECITLLSMRIDEIIENNNNQPQSIDQGKLGNEKKKPLNGKDQNNPTQEQAGISFLDTIAQDSNENYV